MRIAALRSKRLRVPLTRPYAIAGGSWDAVELVVLEIATEGGLIGFGQAAPEVDVTRESIDAAEAELESARLNWLIGRDAEDVELFDELAQCVRGPAARAALDMALHDLHAKHADVPLVERLGRRRDALATSITIGLKSVDETLADAREHVAGGFRALKIKTGVDVGLDLERLSKLRECFGATITLRADANQGYDVHALRRFASQMAALEVELLEQPLPRELDDELRSLHADIRARLVADESVVDELDLKKLVSKGLDRRGSPFGGINVKLMKCGGITPALRMAAIAQRHGLRLMWGCMDESVVGIAAALHAAYACEATSWLDLDGSFDLASDPFVGGFEVREGRRATRARPGLGVERRS
jgi:L-Ala-D/L-Glu epimerase